jgi:hypothetical protein
MQTGTLADRVKKRQLWHIISDLPDYFLIFHAGPKIDENNFGSHASMLPKASPNQGVIDTDDAMEKITRTRGKIRGRSVCMSSADRRFWDRVANF